MPLVIPEHHRYPAKDNLDLPRVQPLRMYRHDDGWLKKVWVWMTKRRQYLVTEHYYTYIEALGCWVWIPQNFVFDFASVPRPLTGLFAPDGPFAYPSGPHDCNYRFGGLLLASGVGEPYGFKKFSRKEADEIFRSMADRDTGFRRLNLLATLVLRAAGWFNYKPRNIHAEDWSKPVIES